MGSLVQFSRREADLPAAVKPAATAVVANLLMALPAAAEPGKIFDFNLTLPIMVAEFLLLMVGAREVPVRKHLGVNSAHATIETLHASSYVCRKHFVPKLLCRKP